MRIKCFISFLAVLLAIPVSTLAWHGAKPLQSCSSPSLQQELEQCLIDLGLDTAASRQELCVALVDITDPANPQMAGVNADTMIYAASLPKIAILLGAFEKINRGELTLDTGTKDTLERMIRNSSNLAATQMLDLIGRDFLLELLQSEPYRLYDKENGGGLWVGKPYGKSPAFKRDPLYNLSHGATAFQVARFYYLLENGQLVSPEMSRVMKEILGRPAIHHKFVRGLEARKPGAEIFRKSGSWREYHADSAIVERDGRKYIAVALARNTQGESWLQRLIVGLDEVVFTCAAQ